MPTSDRHQDHPVDPYYKWVCPLCSSWAVGATDAASVAYGRRLHELRTHDGLSFSAAIAVLRQNNQLAKPS